MTGYAGYPADGAWMKMLGAMCGHVVLLGQVACPAMEVPRGPQCGHWAVLRSCQLLGVSLEMSEVQEQLRSRTEGHSLAQISDVLEHFGLRCEGREETFDRLRQGPFPVIAHLNPDHFVVVIDANNSRVGVFDGDAGLDAWSVAEFAKRWSGRVLRVGRDLRGGRSWWGLRDTGPTIQFDTVLIDKGQVPGMAKTLEYAFTFRNAGSADLVIQKVHVDCGCMEVNRPDAPIPPGGQASITLKYRSSAGSGPFSHSALVQSNDSQVPVVKLCARGCAEGVSLTPSAIDLGAVVAGRRYRRYLNVGGNDKALNVGLKFEGKAGDSDLGFTYFVLQRARIGEFAIAKGGRLLAGYGVLIVVSFVIPPDSAGSEVRGSILVDTQIPGSNSLTVPVRGRVLGGVGTFQADAVKHPL